MKIFSTLVLALAFSLFQPAPTQPSPMELGNFSVSLTVKDIKASRDFYGKLGFAEIGGNIDQKWLVLRNGAAIVGLFQGMFEKNVMTFNPGWNKDGEALESYTDIRELQTMLKSKGVKLMTEVKEGTTGPASFTLLDPDGNPIYFDQHI